MYTQVYKYLLSLRVDIWDNKYYIWIYQPKTKGDRSQPEKLARSPFDPN
ncbi:MAG: hypothetical protein QNJ51_20040 [Calothrix sp. MO_167.B12]|nr:hypothetical protein [Calothrix sp. MO_167.B12]